MTGFYAFFSPSGADHTMRAGRVSRRRGVLRLDGVGRDKAYHGARGLLIARSAPFTFSFRVSTHFSSLAARPSVAWACADAPLTGSLAHRLSRS